MLVLAGCGTEAPPGFLLPGPFPTVTYEPDGPVLGTVVALHGFNDRKAAFDELGQWLKQRGWRLVAYDQAGFGARPDRGYWAGPDKLADDLLYVTRVQAARHPGQPVWILGESLGAAVAIHAAATHGDRLPAAGLILSAPAVWGGDALNPIYRLVLAGTAALFPDMVFTGRGLKFQASDNLPMLIALGKDPLYLPYARADTLEGVVQLMDLARREAPDLDRPVLILNGDKDQVIEPKVQKSFVAAMPAATCRQVRYPDGWHLLLRDLQREVVFADILAELDGSRVGVPCGPGDGRP